MIVKKLRLDNIKNGDRGKILTIFLENFYEMQNNYTLNIKSILEFCNARHFEGHVDKVFMGLCNLYVFCKLIIIEPNKSCNCVRLEFSG